MTYENDRLASNYGFIIESRLDAIEAEYQTLVRTRAAATATGANPNEKLTPELAADARRVIAGQDARGAWIEKTRMRHNKVEPASGVINTQTFAENVRTLCRFITAAAE